MKKILIIRIIRVVVEVIIIITTRNGLKTRNRLKLIGIIDTVGRMAKMNTKVRKVVAQEITELRIIEIVIRIVKKIIIRTIKTAARIVIEIVIGIGIIDI